MVAPRFHEVQMHELVQSGELEIDAQGRIWRLAVRRGNRWDSGTRTIPCAPRRAEQNTGKYLQMRVMVDWVMLTAMAHRLVWYHLNGPIPEGLTINHKNGIWSDNRPENLELATYSQQIVHARTVLLRGRLNQNGERNSMAKLTSNDVAQIRARRATGERLESIARDYPVRMQQISRICRGDRRSLG